MLNTGCPTLAASLFLRLGWDGTTAYYATNKMFEILDAQNRVSRFLCTAAAFGLTLSV